MPALSIRSAFSQIPAPPRPLLFRLPEDPVLLNNRFAPTLLLTEVRRSWMPLHHHRPPKICHFDRRDGAFCRPGAEKSLFNFEFQVRYSVPLVSILLLLVLHSGILPSGGPYDPTLPSAFHSPCFSTTLLCCPLFRRVPQNH